MAKSPDAFRTISEVAEWLGIQAHVLRFWESKFTQVKPVKRAGGRRYYRPNDMLLLGGIKQLLHVDGKTIKEVQKIIRDMGVNHVSELSQSLEEDEETIVEAVAEPQDTPTASSTSSVQMDMELDLFSPSADDELSAELPDTRTLSENLNAAIPEDSDVPEEIAVAQDSVSEPELPETAAETEVAQEEMQLTPTSSEARPAEETAPEAADMVSVSDAEQTEESEVTQAPGVLVQLAKIHQIPPASASEVAICLKELRDWLNSQQNLSAN